MKLSHLSEADGSAVLKFNDDVDELLDTSTKPDQIDAMRTVGTKLFKAGFVYDTKSSDEMVFELITEAGVRIKIWLVYDSMGTWKMHVEAKEGDLEFEWPNCPVKNAAANLDFSKLLQHIDNFYASMDELNLSLRSYPKKI